MNGGEPSVEPSIEGSCDSRFSAVRDAFRDNFRLRNELGAALCIYVDGHRIVDLWGGHQDGERHRKWQHDTLVNIYSVGKGITSMFVLAQVERGLLSLDRPLREAWPEITQAGKERLTLRMLLAHRAGLPGMRQPLPAAALWNWSTITTALAAQEPYWEPSTAHGYHVNTHGFLIGEPLRRRLGKDFGVASREDFTGPLGADYYIGCRCGNTPAWPRSCGQGRHRSPTHRRVFANTSRAETPQPTPCSPRCTSTRSASRALAS